MNKKEEEILEEIIKYVKNNYSMPTMRYLQKHFNYKSINSISRIMKSLENNNYLTRNNENKLILTAHSIHYDKLKTIKIINASNENVNVIIDKRKKYFAYRIHNNYFKNIGILRNDILVIEKKDELKNDDLGLFIIDNKYRIMKYYYKDGFYILEDKEKILLGKTKIIGKVIMIERKL